MRPIVPDSEASPYAGSENNHHAARQETSLSQAIPMRERVRRTLHARHTQAQQVNQDLDDAQDQTRQRSEEKSAPLRASLRELQDAREVAEGAAIEALGQVGAKWDPDHPTDEAAVLRVARRDDHEIAAKLGLPFPVSPRDARLTAWVSWILVGPAGAMLGLSGGILAHFLESDALTRDVVALLLCLCIGIGAASSLKLAVQHLSGETTEQYFLERPSWVSWMRATILFIGMALVGEIAVQRSGVLATQELLPDGLKRTADAGYRLALWALPVILNAGFLLTSAFVGYYSSRAKPIINRISDRKEEQFRQESEQRRADPRVKLALQALGDLDQIRDMEQKERARLEAIEQRSESSIKQLRACRVPLPPMPAPPREEAE